jgi:hypothetical protein
MAEVTLGQIAAQPPDRPGIDALGAGSRTPMMAAENSAL